jgi:hypothetical protein
MISRIAAEGWLSFWKEMNSTAVDFTYEWYRNLLLYLKETLGYEICRVDSVPEDRNYVVLRHDVDFSLVRALEMARVDKACGVRSTFFILMECDYYDAVSSESVDRMMAIQELGHEIGLHYDASKFKASDRSGMIDEVRCLAERLGSIIGMKIRSVAQHKPSSSKVRLSFDDFIDAYSQDLFDKIGYVSDSRMHFMERDLEGFFRINRKSQLLIHPIWWSSERRSRQQVFQDLSEEQGGRFDSLLESEKSEIDKFFAQK